MAIMVHDKWTQELGPKLLDRDRGRSTLEPISKSNFGKPDALEKYEQNDSNLFYFDHTTVTTVVIYY